MKFELNVPMVSISKVTKKLVHFLDSKKPFSRHDNVIFSEHLLTDMNTTVVIENATFYSVPDENWLNCSRGPLGPLAMGGLASSEVELGSLGRHQQSIFAGVSGFSSLTNVRYVVLMCRDIFQS